MNRLMTQGKLITLLLLSQLVAACTTTNIDQFRQGETQINETDSIVILGRREKNAYETEEDFVQCVADVVGSGRDGIEVVPERAFLDGMFPFFEPRTAPMRTNHLQQILNEDIAVEKLDDLGVEYIVWLDGRTETVDKSGSMSCTVSPGGGGCFGFATWENDSKYEAEIWHLDSQTSVGSISTDANGQSYMPAIVIPIPLIARVEANACSGMGNQLKEFLQGTS